MTKQDIIRTAAKAAGVTQETASAIINAALEAAADALAAGEQVKIYQFGTLEVRRHKPRTVHNFTTGEPMQRPASNTVAFVAAAALKSNVNKGGLNNGHES